jgi:hypothetical protein
VMEQGEGTEEVGGGSVLIKLSVPTISNFTKRKNERKFNLYTGSCRCQVDNKIINNRKYPIKQPSYDMDAFGLLRDGTWEGKWRDGTQNVPICLSFLI